MVVVAEEGCREVLRLRGDGRREETVRWQRRRWRDCEGGVVGMVRVERKDLRWRWHYLKGLLVSWP